MNADEGGLVLYDSRPKEREGEPVEYVVPEAINATASKERQSSDVPQPSVPWPEWLPESKAAFAGAAAIAVVEALILLLILVL